MKKRILSILLAAIMIVSLLPVTAAAADPTAYTITDGTAQDAHGSISFDKTYAAEEDTVTVTVNPATGYKLKSLTVAPTGFVDLGIKDAEGKPLYWKETNLGTENAGDPGDYYMWGATALMYSAVDRSKTDGAFTFVTENPYGGNYKNTWDASLGFNVNNVPFADGVFNSPSNTNVFTKYTTIDTHAKSGTPDNITTLQPEDDAATAKNANWHTPTYDEFFALRNNCVLVWTDNYNSTGNAGYIVYKAKNDADKGKKNSEAPESYSISDIHIFLPAAGYGNGTKLENRNGMGIYCSSNLNTSRNDYVGAVGFNKSLFNIGYNNFRDYGFSIRPVMSFSGITPVKQTDGTYQFTMPDYAVTVTAEFEEAGVTVSTWSDLQTAITDATEPTTIKLTNNLTAPAEGGERFVIPAGKDIVLDLNGHTLDRGLSEEATAVERGNVFTVNGKLTIKDGSETKTGTIIGGTSAYGAAIISNGETILESGTITGCKATSTDYDATNSQLGRGGAIYVNKNGKFTMSGGEIKDCSASVAGGAIFNVGTANITGGKIDGCSVGGVSDGEIVKAKGGAVYNFAASNFTMTGGVISGNTLGKVADMRGAGVYAAANANVALGGTAKITGNAHGDNEANNLFLYDGAKLTLGTKTGDSGEAVGNGVLKPTSGMSVGVTMASAPGAFTDETATDAKYATYFTSDNAEYFVNFSTNHLELKKTAYLSGSTLYVDGMVRRGSLDAIQNKDTITAIVVSATVTGAEENAFAGFGSVDVPVALTLPDGWQGDLPDEEGNWYGAKVKMNAVPTAVKNVTFQQRWPWNGNVDIAFTVTGTEGEKNVTVTVKDGSTVLKSIPQTVTINNNCVGTGKCVWDANEATSLANSNSENVTVEVAMVGPAAGQLWEGGPIWADSNLGESEIDGHPEYGALYKFADTGAYVAPGWRVPTKEEFDKLINDCTGAWDDTKGYTFTGKGDYSSQSITLPAAGMESGGRSYAGVYGYYWSSTREGQDTKCLFFSSGQSSVANRNAPTYAFSVRPVKDAAPTDITTVTSATSAKGTIDLRTEIALPEKSVNVAGVTWSATAWGTLPESTSTNIGWKKMGVTPDTTGKIAEGLAGNKVAPVSLPAKDGTYHLTHSAGDLTSFVAFTVSGYPSCAITNGTAATGAHGSITLPENAVVGNDVVVTVTPDTGYALKTLKYNDGTTDYDITKDATTGEYQFTMPAKAVTVTATFEANVPIFDACGGTGAEWNDGTKTVSTPSFGSYVFAGWYDAKIGGNKVESNFTAGTTYYAHWTNAAGNTVLTDAVEIKATGVHIGGSGTAATDTELEEYGLVFAAATDSAPVTLEMSDASIESGDGILAGSWTLNDKNVYAGIYSELGIELKLTGNNKVSIARNDMNTVPCGGYFHESLIVTGSGTLTFDASNAKGYRVYGVDIIGALTNSATLTGKGGTATKSANGLSFGCLENTAGTLTGYAGSAQYANGFNNGGYSEINITGGKVIGYGGTGTDEYYGLWTAGDINVSGTGILEVHGGTKDSVKQAALFLEASDKIITVAGNGKIVADSAVKNDGKYADGYTVTGADTDIASKSAGSTLTKAGDANIEITNKTYTVSFNANGGTPVPSAQSTMAYVTEPDPMTKTGYVFAGWYKDAAFTQAWNFDTNYARQDITLYAKWAKQEAVATTVRGAVDGENDIPIDEADVFLKRGDVIYDHYTTGTTGEFSFSNVPAGIYQLVVTKGDYTTTSLVNVFSGVPGINVGFVTLHMTTKTSSKVEITGNDTPDVMVGDLEHVADMRQLAGNTVSVTLEVEKLAENAVKPGDKTKIEAAAGNAQTLDYIDMTLLLRIGTGTPTTIPDTGEGKLLEVVIPYHLSGRNNIALYRQHGSDESAVKLPEGADNAVDGEYVIIDKENNLIRAFLRYFSTYAIGYEEEQSHGGGGGGTSSYAVELPANVKNGKVEVSPKNASAGSTVTLTVTPDKGFTLETLTVLDKNGKEVEVKNLGNNKYSFKMPSGKVSISATFMENNSMLNFFVDVKATDYYYDAVLWAAENDITKGTDDVHFSPSIGVTRGQVVTFLWRAAGKPVVNYAMNMSDVASGAYYTEAVRWALAEGITKGTSATTFDPNAVCTRGQIVTFLARFAGVEDADTESVFTDVPANEFFAAAVKWAKDNGVTSGVTDTTFEPYTNCNRAQIVTFLYRWMVK